MESWLSSSPYARPLLGLLAVIFALFLIKFIVRQMFNFVKFLLVLGLIAIGLIFYFDHAGYFKPGGNSSTGAGGSSEAAGAPDFSKESEADQTTPAQLYAQIVDTDDKDKYAERAILEGRPFKYVLMRVSKTSRVQLVKEVNDRTTFENLTDEPELHRGEAYAPGRGVIVEVSTADLGPEYGLPGWTVSPAVFINTAHEIFALRILCAPGSKVFEKLSGGIAQDKLPVVNLAGVFFKNYARMTGDKKEQPWVKPLLVCPELEFVTSEEPRQVLKELQDTGYGKLLPTTRIDADAAEERLVLDVALNRDGTKIRAWGADSAGDVQAFVTAAVRKLKKRLPADQAAHAAAVILCASPANDPRVQQVWDALKAAGMTRGCVKLSPSKPNAAAPGK